MTVETLTRELVERFDAGRRQAAAAGVADMALTAALRTASRFDLPGDSATAIAAAFAGGAHEAALPRLGSNWQVIKDANGKVIEHIYSDYESATSSVDGAPEALCAPGMGTDYELITDSDGKVITHLDRNQPRLRAVQPGHS
ncbi:MAG TPA: hypothetical protein VLF69_06515 [Candidatus Saccharimonadales bacterium]|nr:hypothetical protein [Candidatus Saccharimonadales bacterium]